MHQLRSIIESVLDEFASLTGLDLSGVISATPREGGWTIEVEMIERRAVPDALDVLGIYELKADPDGHLEAFRRKALRHRGNVEAPATDDLGPDT